MRRARPANLVEPIQDHSVPRTKGEIREGASDRVDPLMIFLVVLCAAALAPFVTSRRQAATAVVAAAATAAAIPDPAVDEKLAANWTETLVLAGGCFWGVQTVFKHVKGVI